MQSFGFVIDLIPTAFQTNGSLSEADFLARNSGIPSGTAAYFVIGIPTFAYGWFESGIRRWAWVVVGGVILILGLIQWQLGRSLF